VSEEIYYSFELKDESPPIYYNFELKEKNNLKKENIQFYTSLGLIASGFALISLLSFNKLL
jgi:hypothetical protein